MTERLCMCLCVWEKESVCLFIDRDVRVAEHSNSTHLPWLTTISGVPYIVTLDRSEWTGANLFIIKSHVSILFKCTHTFWIEYNIDLYRLHMHVYFISRYHETPAHIFILNLMLFWLFQKPQLPSTSMWLILHTHLFILQSATVKPVWQPNLNKSFLHKLSTPVSLLVGHKVYIFQSLMCSIPTLDSKV